MEITPASFSNAHGNTTRPRMRVRALGLPGGGLSQFEGSGRSAGKLGPNTATRGTDDSGPLERRTHDEDRLADHSRMRGRSCGTTEVHAQVAVPIFVHAIGIAVHRVGRETYDQCDGRDQCDQSITAKTRAQDEGTIWGRSDKPSVRVASGQLAAN